MLLDHNKHIIAVLKKNRNALLEDAEGIFSQQQQLFDQGKKHSLIWDDENFEVDGLEGSLRVVKSVEITTIKSRLKKKRISRQHLEMAEHDEQKTAFHQGICRDGV